MAAAASSFGILALLVAIACAVNLSTPDAMMEERQMFRDYVHFYHKNYTHAEYELRFLNFQESLRRINQLNQKYTKTKFGINQFSDMSVNEFRRSRLMSEKITGEAMARSCLSNGVTASDIDTNAIPTSFDWRDKGVVTPVKDQGQCGSCWAFSTIGNIESQFAIHKKGPLTQFSEQMLVDCSQGCSNEPPYGPVCNQGCNGGWQWNAFFDVISWGGIETETDYPYSGVDGTCNYSVKKLHAPLKNYTCLTTNASVGVDETKMAAFLVQNGPLSIALDAELLMDYSSGIIVPQPGDCSGESLDHALLLVGYGVDSTKTPYWIVKNSWASTWGESGYFRIIRGQSACGLNNAVSSAILK